MVNAFLRSYGLLERSRVLKAYMDARKGHVLSSERDYTYSINATHIPCRSPNILVVIETVTPRNKADLPY